MTQKVVMSKESQIKDTNMQAKRGKEFEYTLKLVPKTIHFSYLGENRLEQKKNGFIKNVNKFRR